MAWARPPGAPQPASCPLEAMEPRKNQYTSLVDIFGLPLVFGLFGVLGPAASNYYLRRPFYTGLWRHITMGAGLGYLGMFVRDIRKEIIDERDEVIRQYIALHPEDFPAYEKKLYKDVLLPWTPTR